MKRAFLLLTSLLLFAGIALTGACSSVGTVSSPVAKEFTDVIVKRTDVLVAHAPTAVDPIFYATQKDVLYKAMAGSERTDAQVALAQVTFLCELHNRLLAQDNTFPEAKKVDYKRTADILKQMFDEAATGKASIAPGAESKPASRPAVVPL